MFRSYFLARFAGVIGLSVLLTSCVSSAEDSASSTSSGEDDTVTIGVVMASSGFLGPIDTPPLNSMRLAVDDLNDAGGIDGKQVEIDYIDTESNLDRYASAATELIDRGADVLVVSCDYDVSSPAALVAETANVLSIAPCVGDPIYGPSGGLDLGFSMGDGTPGEASVMAEFASDQGWRNVALLADTTLKYTTNECSIFADRFSQLGGTVISTQEYQQGDSVREQVSQIAGGQVPDAVVNCGYTPGGATVAKELRDGGVTAPIISGFGMDGDFWTDSVPGLSDYYVVTYAAKNGDDPDAAVNDAVAAYEDAYGELPTTGGFVTGPSTLQAIQAAYADAGSWDGDALTESLETIGSFDTLAGPTTFSADLHISVDRPQRVLVVQDGQLTFVEQRAAQEVVFAQ